jgi:hypothetical protein
MFSQKKNDDGVSYCKIELQSKAERLLVLGQSEMLVEG